MFTTKKIFTISSLLPGRIIAFITQIKEFCMRIIHQSTQMKHLLFTIFFLAMLFFSVLSAEAANRYVRAGATGANNGTDWTNAYTTLPASLVRGNTYFIADGTYAGYTFDDDASGTTLITIKKATTSSHGTDTGWVSTYGDGQAVFGGLQFTRPYYTIDGVSRNESNWKDYNAYGIQVSEIRASRLDGGHSPSGECSADNLTFNYLHVGTDTTTWATGTDSRSLYLGGFGSGATACQNWTFSHGLIQNTLEVQCAGCSDLLIEKTYFYSGWSKEAIRGQIFGDRVTVRWNVFEDACQMKPGTTDRCTAEIAAWDGTSFSDWKIYGNVFYKSYKDPQNSNGVVIVGDAGWGGAIGPTTSNSVASNNTIAGFGVNSGTRVIMLEGGSGNVVRNNLAYDCLEPATFTANTTSNNFYSTSNPFTNYAGKNFHLSSATTAGTTLASPYNTDMDGNTRGADGTWDIGAYEYLSGGVSLSPPSPPTLLAVQ